MSIRAILRTYKINLSEKFSIKNLNSISNTVLRIERHGFWSNFETYGVPGIKPLHKKHSKPTKHGNVGHQRPDASRL